MFHIIWIDKTFLFPLFSKKPLLWLTLNPLITGPNYILPFFIIIFSTINTTGDINQNISKLLTSILSNPTNFYSLEDVDRVSETQLQVSENSN